MIKRITRRRKNINPPKICSECKRLIDNVKLKGMKCLKCGKIICFRCNIGYKCKDCYIDVRQDYYKENKLECEIII